jgi:hypothetical protein
MLALKRVLLVIFVLAMPVILTALLYWGTLALLAATNRVIDPNVIDYAAIAEFLAFLWVGILEARSRW